MTSIRRIILVAEKKYKTESKMLLTREKVTIVESKRDLENNVVKQNTVRIFIDNSTSSGALTR